MSDPYAKDAQIFTFGVHGTINTPENVREVTQRISAAVGSTTDGANLWDNGFDWRARTETVMRPQFDPHGNYMGEAPVSQNVAGTAHQMNGTRDREIASERFAAHVLQQVDNAIERGALDRDKPLTLNLVGFSHGGNVSILAADEISEGMFRNVGDVAFGQNGQTAFVTDRDKADPAARVAPVDMALASKPTEQVMDRFAVALDTARTQAVAQETQEQQQRQNAPRMA
jgi:hypothetical protein